MDRLLLGTTRKKASLIVAVGKDWVIANNNLIPWKISDEFKFFKSQTLGHAIIMGSKTWLSLPKKPLPDRLNIVLSSGLKPTTGAVFAKNWRDAFDAAAEKEIFIIGGASVYGQALEQGMVNRMLISFVKGNYTGDTYFPKFNEDRWNKKPYFSHELFDVVEYLLK